MRVDLRWAKVSACRPDKTIAIIPNGNPGMATAGSGDVLTGTIAGFFGGYGAHLSGLSEIADYKNQILLPLFNALAAGMYIHALAGDLSANMIGQEGMMAGDILEDISDAIKYIKEGSVEKYYENVKAEDRN